MVFFCKKWVGRIDFLHPNMPVIVFSVVLTRCPMCMTSSVQKAAYCHDRGSKLATLDSLVLLTLLLCDTTVGLAQSVECLTAEQEVAGSILGFRPILRVLK